MQENGHINNHHHKSSNSLHLLRAHKVPGPVFKHFPYLVFTITREESTTIIPTYRGENCLSDVFKASVCMRADMYAQVLLTPISWVSRRSLSMKFIRSRGCYKNVTKGRKCHKNKEEEGTPCTLSRLTKLSLYSYGNWGTGMKLSWAHTNYSVAKWGHTWL